MPEQLISSFESNLYLQLKRASALDKLLVAFSGGLDSKVLLHALYRLQSKKLINRFRAIHVNHGLQSEADEWQAVCENDCRSYAIGCVSRHLKLDIEGNANIELLARNGRYEIFEQYLQSDEILLLAHHQNDQAETLLLRLLRGCGLDGAAAIPIERKLGKNRLLRPLLNVSKKALEAYADFNQLGWIDDPSNQSNHYARNFLRNKLFPVIEEKWPSYTKTLARFSSLAAEQSLLLKEVAIADFSSADEKSRSIEIEEVKRLSLSRQKNALHYWAKSFTGLPPSHQEIMELLKQLNAAPQSAIEVKFSTGKARSFLGRLYFCNSSEPDKMSARLRWADLTSSLRLSRQLIISSQPAAQSTGIEGVRLPFCDELVWVDYRRGGERCCPSDRGHSTELKKIYQERAVPPWQRKWLPVVYYNDKIVSVPGVFVSKAFVSRELNTAIYFRVEADYSAACESVAIFSVDRKTQ